MRLKLPSKVKVRSRTYAVKRDSKVPQSTLGDVDVRLREIRISTKKLHHSEVSDTFWHEVTHAILYDMRSPQWKNERFVTALASRINEVFLQLPK